MHHVCLTKQGLCVGKQSLCIFQTEAHSCKERPLSSSNRASVWTKQGICICLVLLFVFFMRLCLNPDSNRNCLKKRYFLDLVCSLLIVIITIGVSYSNRSRLKKWYFLDLVCSVPIVTLKIGVSCNNRSRLKKWHFLDLVCSVHIVTITSKL